MTKKQLILSVLLLMTVVRQAHAGDHPTLAHPHHGHHHPHHGYDIGGYEGGEEGGSYIAHNAIDEKIFLENLPKEPGAALRYFFEEANKAEIKADKYTTMRLELEIVDDVAGRDPISVEPKLESKGQLTIKVQLAKSVENNVVATFEIMSRLNAMMTSDGVDLNVFKETTNSYHTPKKYLYHPKTGHYLGIHHEAGYHTIHYKSHVVQTVIHLFGVKQAFNRTVRNPLIWTELKINAANGSQLALRELAEYEMQTKREMRDGLMTYRFSEAADAQGKLLRDIREMAKLRGLDLSTETMMSEGWLRYTEAELAKQEAELASRTKLATQELREMKKQAADPAIKARRDQLESQPEKLEALLKKNDREGVAKLLEAFVPWAELSPFEGAMWSDWIKAIRKPNPNDTVVLFRGIDEKDAVQVAKDANGKEIGHGFFATLLSKNQGNYTRRLRSIQTMRAKFANSRTQVLTPLQETPKIGNIMINHSGDPVGSPFMSFTTTSSIAHQWGQKGGVIIANLDKRRVLPNVNSSIKGELEMLVPLIIFPDEVIHFAKPTDPGFQVGLKTALAEASRKLGREIPEVTILDTNETFRSAYKSYAKAQRFLSSTKSCKITFPKDAK